MLRDLEELLAIVPGESNYDAYAEAVVRENVLGKQTAATRRLSLQRLRELYGLDLRVPIFRVLRRLWEVDRPGRPRLALLVALARDPLLAATAEAVLSLPVGAEMLRSELLAQLRERVGRRLNDAVLDKVARNAASSWAQAGFLRGRVRKVRRQVKPTPATAALALWLARCDGYSAGRLLDSPWARVCGGRGDELLPFVLRANQLGYIRARAAAGNVSIDPGVLDPVASRAAR